MGKRGVAGILAVLFVLLSVPFAQAASLAEGEHILWIDRLAEEPEMPEAVRDLYGWLESEGAKGADGVLADPTRAEFFAQYGFYGYELAVLRSREPVRVMSGEDPGSGQQDVWQAIRNYQQTSGMQEQIQSIVAYALAVTHAFNRDHPEVFWASGGIAVMLPVSYTSSRRGEANFVQRIMLCFYKEDEGVDSRTENCRDLPALREDIAALDEAADAILAQLPEGSRREQLAFLNRWLTEHNSYRIGEPDPDSRSPLTALLGSDDENGPVCEGYARAMKILCDRAGIPCVLVSGNAYYEKGGTPIPHMWNSVQMEDGKWYGLDVTWNDPVVYEENGQRIPGAVSGYEDEQFFLVGRETEADGMRFADSHVMTNDVTENGLHFVNGPVLSAQAYSEYDVCVETEGQSVFCKSFAEVAAAADGKTAVLTLLRDADAVPALSPSAGSAWTLELNGCVLEGKTKEDAFFFTVREGVSLTVCDSSGDRSGRIRTNGKVFSAAGGTIRLEIQKKFIRT